MHVFTHLEDAVDLRNTLHNKLDQPLDIHPLLCALLHLQPLVGVLTQQVPHLFLINFQIRRPDQVLAMLTCVWT